MTDTRNLDRDGFIDYFRPNFDTTGMSVEEMAWAMFGGPKVVPRPYENRCLLTDTYKPSHIVMYPENAEGLYSYIGPRGGEFDEAVFFGAQALLMKYLAKPLEAWEVEEAKDYFDKTFGAEVFNYDAWMHIVNDHNGKWPLHIKAVPEGTVMPNKNVMMTVQYTCSDCLWLVNYMETLLSHIWFPSTVATVSRECKKIIAKYMDETAGHRDGLEFKLHDFGCRGTSSMESAAIGGAGHLVNFLGTDTVPALKLCREVYGEDMAGHSIPAGEHSTFTAHGPENEVEAYRQAMRKYPTGLLACVSDSYDIYNACKNIWGGVLKDEVLARDGTIVIRPDSGDPEEVVPKILNILGEQFGATTNSLGYKVLPPQVRVIQGDGITVHSLPGILEAVKAAGWSAENLAFGMGGGLLQQCNRDTLKFAFKASAIKVDGVWKDVYKDPVTDSGKKSFRGKLMVISGPDGKPMTCSLNANEYPDLLETIYNNGEIQRFTTLKAIRERAAIEPATVEVVN